MAGSLVKQCECVDPGCPKHPLGHCAEVTRTQQVYRVDMTDRTGTAMCEPCRDDALETGVYSLEAPA